MTEAHVGEEREMHCTDCEADRTHFLYHSGEWVCMECGNGD